MRWRPRVPARSSRRFPCRRHRYGGVVVESADGRFKAGDAVIATSFDIGVAHHGGYAEMARVPANGSYPAAGTFDVRGDGAGDCRIHCSAGYRAHGREWVDACEGAGDRSGATGGVGSLAVDMLARRGYHVVALTGKESETAFLKELGAAEVMLRQSLNLEKIRPLDKALWASAVDNLGGDVLAWMASTMKQGGTIASIGLAASHTLNTTVMPFILRGASLLGIDSGYIGEPYRSGIWQRLASDMKPPHLAAMARKVAFDELPGLFPEYLAGHCAWQGRGRRWRCLIEIERSVSGEPEVVMSSELGSCLACWWSMIRAWCGR